MLQSNCSSLEEQSGRSCWTFSQVDAVGSKLELPVIKPYSSFWVLRQSVAEAVHRVFHVIGRGRIPVYSFAVKHVFEDLLIPYWTEIHR